MKEGWKYVKLGEAFPFIKNGANIKQTKGASGIPITRIETLANGVFNKDRLGYANITDSTKYENYILKSGDILMSHINSVEHVGRAVACRNIDFKLIHGMNLLRLIPIKEADSFFYEYYFKTDSFKTRIQAITHKSVNQASFNTTNLKEIKIPLPPLSEQQSIVAHLDASFAEIDALKAKAAEEVANAKAMFDAALREEMTPKEDFPSDKLVNVFNFIDYRGATPTKLSSGIPLVTAKNVKKGYIDYTIKDYISETEYSQRQSRGISHKGDILFTTEAPLGNVALADLEVFSAGQRLITFQQYDSPKYVVENKYYMYYFLSYGFQNTLNKLATGATAQGIKAKILKEVIIPVPPISTQQRIVAKLDTLRSHLTELEQKYNHIAANCDALKQAILRETFE